ncbi:MAG TPA: RMD1 family protein [Burkholderiales bacterium]|nr:RMD1 family protein [Burkholderiales bacterium]
MGTVGRPDFKVRAVLAADRIDLRAWKAEERLASNPLAVAVAGGGAAVLFRYGVVVFFDVTPEEEAAFLDQLAPLLSGRFAMLETEDVQVRIDPRAHERMEGEIIFVADDQIERLQIIADILSKSVILAYYETRMQTSFDLVEPLALELERTGRIAGGSKDLRRHMGSMLLTQQAMVGRFAVIEKPELLWDHPGLEGLYIRLEDEFEIKERHEDIQRKLALIERVVQTLAQLQETRHSMRLELYIVILIVVEVLLSVYELFFRQM